MPLHVATYLIAEAGAYAGVDIQPLIGKHVAEPLGN